MTSRITQLNVRNFMGIEAVQIEPDGNVVVINGENGSGKTSVLTAIWAMLASKAGLKDIDEPVHAGAKTAVIEGVIDLGDGDGLRITRTFSASGMKVKVTTLDGSNIGSPEGALKKLFTRISFDPLAFSNMKPKEQVEFYLRAVDTELDLDELNVKRAGIYDQRTEVNREAATAQTTLEGLAFSSADPDAEEVSGASIMAEREAAQAVVDERARIERLQQTRGHEYEMARERVKDLESELARAIEQRDEARRDFDEANAVEMPSAPDLSGFSERLTAVEETNREIRLAKQRHALSVAGIDAAARAAELTTKLDEIDAQKRAVIAAVPQIVPGLTFDEEGMFLNGTPLAQASGSERLLVSCQVGIALNPEVRVMTLQDGPLLDAKSMRLLEQIAEEHDFQVWVERQMGTDADGVGFTISEGKVTERPMSNGITIIAEPFPDIASHINPADTDYAEILADFGPDERPENDDEVDEFFARLEADDGQVYSAEKIAEMDRHADEQSRERAADEDGIADEAPPIWESLDGEY